MITILKYTNGSIQRTNNPYRDIIFSITESDTVLTLSFDLINNYGKKIHTIISEVNKQDNADKITTIVMSEKSGSITSKIVNNYTKIGFTSADYQQDYGDINLARLYISEDMKDVCIYLYFPAPNVLGCTNIEVKDDPAISSFYLFQYCESAKKIYDNWMTKQTIIGNPIDMSKSITYLESQVDILYKILNSIVAKTNIDVSEFKSVIDAIDANSVLNIKTQDKIVEELNTDKAEIRRLQKQYYESKHNE
jgi:hypothetical protein